MKQALKARKAEIRVSDCCVQFWLYEENAKVTGVATRVHNSLWTLASYYKKSQYCT